MSTPVSPTVQEFLNRLNGVRANGSGWSARCPCRNDDDNPSLSIGEGRDGQVLVTCHRGNGCSVDQICDAVHLDLTDLFPPKLDDPKGSRLHLTNTYSYLDANGELLFQKLRYVDMDSGKKTFRQRKPDGRGGWTYTLGDTPRVLYNLPAVAQAIRDQTPIWVVEGEKDADNLITRGHVATTPPNGAGKWLDIHTDSLADGHIVVVCDNDEPGRAHANMVVRELKTAGCTVTCYRPPDEFKDVSDMFVAGHDIDALIEVGATIRPDVFTEVVQSLEDLARKTNLSIHQKVTQARSLLDAAVNDLPLEDLAVRDWWDFVNEDVTDEYDWIIPGLLERTDRTIIVAAEGSGKTMLARQVAIMTAWGLHPFTRQTIPPIRTLTIDLENPERIVRRKSASIHFACQHFTSGKKITPYAKLVLKPDGMNLLKATDRVLFERAVKEHQPDLLIIGPLYKSFIDPGNRSSEAIATETIMFLDHIRHTYQCAMWMEQHAPLGSTSGREMRPFGSAVWSRWPEFGKALVRDVTAHTPNTFKVENFRGDRDERHWPTLLKWGTTFPFDAVEFRDPSK